jgi:hypothetical protein
MWVVQDLIAIKAVKVKINCLMEVSGDSTVSLKVKEIVTMLRLVEYVSSWVQMNYNLGLRIFKLVV